jgi:hypothetical protein
MQATPLASSDNSFTIPSLYSSSNESKLLTLSEFLAYEADDEDDNQQFNPPSIFSFDFEFPVPDFQMYTHPIWKNWKAVWNQEPLAISLELLSVPQDEKFYPDARFRFYLAPGNIKTLLEGPVFCQGMTLVLGRCRSPDARYVIEWNEGEDDQFAYLRVVGTTSSGIPIPYDNRDFPTFILAIPKYLAAVPHRPVSSIDNLAGHSFLEDAPSSGGSSGIHMFKIIRKVMKSVCKLFAK